MKVTRKGVFETNSSSSHSLCIDSSTEMVDWRKHFSEDPKIESDEFGWEVCECNDPKTKMSYLATAVANIQDSERRQRYIEKLTKAFKDHTGQTISLQKKTDGSFWEYGYIDHQSENVAFKVLDGVEQDIIDFVFRPGSVLRTDNDNH